MWSTWSEAESCASGLWWTMRTEREQQEILTRLEGSEAETLSWCLGYRFKTNRAGFRSTAVPWSWKGKGLTLSFKFYWIMLAFVLIPT